MAARPKPTAAAEPGVAPHFDLVGARVSACDVAVATGDDALMLWFGQREPRQDGVGVVARHRIGLEIGAARHLEQALASLLADLQGAAAATPSGGDAT